MKEWFVLRVRGTLRVGVKEGYREIKETQSGMKES